VEKETGDARKTIKRRGWRARATYKADHLTDNVRQAMNDLHHRKNPID
jgi:hypothetical protein